MHVWALCIFCIIYNFHQFCLFCQTWARDGVLVPKEIDDLSSGFASDQELVQQGFSS